MLVTKNTAIKTTIIFILLILLSCEKDPLTLPTKVNFEFEFISYVKENTINQKSDLKYTSSVSNQQLKLEIDGGAMIVESITFDGRREEGKDVFFTSDFQEPINVDLKTERSNKDIIFDIPQGIYNKIDIDLEICGNNEEIPLILEGFFVKELFNGKSGPVDDVHKFSSFEEVNVRFEYDINEKIRVRAESGNNRNNIVLKRDNIHTANIIFDAGSAFTLVDLGMMQNADQQIKNGKNTILINKDNNQNIYSIIAARMDKSFSIIID